MRPFSEIVAMAAERHGGMTALDHLLAQTRSRSPEEIAATPDDRVLAEMTRRVFHAGFSSKVIDGKWEGFEQAFDGFDVRRCAAFDEARLDSLLQDDRIVRNGAKIHAVQANAQFVLALAADRGSAARFFAGWPDDDYVGLLEVLKTRGNRLGGESGMRFLRALGKPAFITTPDVAAALVREGVLAGPPAGKRDLQTVQQAFNAWAAESGYDLTAISRILAMSSGQIGPRRHR